MTLNYVTLTLDLYDGQGNPVNGGVAAFAPTVRLTDTADHELITEAPVTAAFKASGSPAVRLLATDNGAPLPAGWAWTVSFTGVPGDPAGFSFFLPYASGASQYLSSQAPVSTAVTQFPLNPMTAAGDIIYGASSPAGTPQRLGIGSSGQVLTVSGGLPSWQNSNSTDDDSAYVTLGTVQTITGNKTFTGLLSMTSLNVAIRTVTADYTATASDCVIIANCSGSDIHVPIPGASSVTGRAYCIMKTGGGGGVHIQPASGSINGITDYVLGNPLETITIISDGTNYQLIGQPITAGSQVFNGNKSFQGGIVAAGGVATDRFSVGYAVKTADYTFAGNDYYVQASSATPVTITLPDATFGLYHGRICTVKNVSTGAVTVATQSSQTIDGASTYSLASQYKYVAVISDSLNWYVIANN